MNLQENIQRIKEVMGITEHTIPISIKRRANHDVMKEYISRAELEYPTLCDDFEDEYEYADAVIDYAVDKLIDEVDDSIFDEDYISDVLDYLRNMCRNLFGQYLIDTYKTTCAEYMSEAKESGEKWIKCVNCKKKFTQTIHKGKKSLPICPHCGTNNDLVSEQLISTGVRRRLVGLDDYIKEVYRSIIDPRSMDSLEEYLAMIIFNVAREISQSSGIETYDELMDMRERISSYIEKYIIDNFSEEIEKYYLNSKFS